ncbi:MAG: LysR family transcriptional regulator [Achromobacter sp.]|nr:LysR family transcriptional regulator [Achromobacter sp.]
MNEVRALTIFVRTAMLGSLRKAAVDQGISPQAASHAVMQLEKSLGVQLLRRTTRKLSLTEEGRRLLDNASPALGLLSAALADARRASDEISGPLRISAPRALIHCMLWQYVLAFAREYPGVQLDVHFDDRLTDLVGDRADVGFRGGSLPAAGTVARRLVPIQLLVCAAPDYLARHGAPTNIDDLARHRCTGFVHANAGKLAPWAFQVDGEQVYREITPALCMNDIDAEAQTVLAGEAIGQLGSFTAVPHIRAGRLVPLLLRHAVDLEGIYLYYGRRTEQPLRVRTFVDFMVRRLEGNRQFFLGPDELR